MKTNITRLILDAKNHIEMLGLKPESIGLTQEDYRFLKHEVAIQLNMPVPNNITSFHGLPIGGANESVIAGINPFTPVVPRIISTRLFSIRTLLEITPKDCLDYKLYGFSAEGWKMDRDEINERD